MIWLRKIGAWMIELEVETTVVLVLGAAVGVAIVILAAVPSGTSRYEAGVIEGQTLKRLERERFCEGWDAARAFDPLDDADRMAEVLKRTHTLGDPQKTCWHPERVRASNATPDDVWCFPASGGPTGATCVRPK